MQSCNGCWPEREKRKCRAHSGYWSEKMQWLVVGEKRQLAGLKEKIENAEHTVVTYWSEKMQWLLVTGCRRRCRVHSAEKRALIGEEKRAADWSEKRKEHANWSEKKTEHTERRGQHAERREDHAERREQ
ncbi:hypothetical protein RJT34_02665 [Clitoria ternatea]|uniref:Uncharacterized protein n=1 Tax=Clitoria ternatea TaxID=43366 RepID=A0AAN9KI08_CLITE